MTEEEFVDKYMLDWKNVIDERNHVIPFERLLVIDMLKKNPGLFKSFQEAMECEI